jgi:hypothetical protein
MNCHDAQESILESFYSELHPQRKDLLRRHLAGCAACVSFAAVQSQLEAQLRQEISAPALSADFSALVRKKASSRLRMPVVLPPWLPDIAYATGCAAGLVICMAALPFPPSVTAGIGAMVAAGGYLVQGFLLASFQRS